MCKNKTIRQVSRYHCTFCSCKRCNACHVSLENGLVLTQLKLHLHMFLRWGYLVSNYDESLSFYHTCLILILIIIYSILKYIYTEIYAFSCFSAHRNNKTWWQFCFLCIHWILWSLPKQHWTPLLKVASGLQTCLHIYMTIYYMPQSTRNSRRINKLDLIKYTMKLQKYFVSYQKIWQLNAT